MKVKVFAASVLIFALLGMTGCSTEEAHEHVWDNGVVTEQPSCTEDGIKIYTCTGCNQTRQETIAAMGHATSAPVRENVSAATCTEDGSYDEVVYCLVCDAEISRETVEVTAAGHKPATAVRENEVEATCITPGSYDEVVYCSVCDEVLERTTVTGELGDHSWDEGEVEAERTLTTDGKIVYTCSVCHEEREETLPAGAYFADDFSLTDSGAWLYGYVNYKWEAPEDFTFVEATSNGTDAWIADGVEIKEAWINAGAMTTIGYTVTEDINVNVNLSFTGGTGLTKLALRVGIKNGDGAIYSNPSYTNGNTISLNQRYALNAGDTIYFIFSNEAGDVEGAYPNGDLSISLTPVKPVAQFSEDFLLTTGGAWKYGYVNYQWGASENFEFVEATSNGTDAWTADGVEIKAGWINASAMTTIAYTATEDMTVNVNLLFTGGTEQTKLALRVGIKNSEGALYSNPTFHGPNNNTTSLSQSYTLKAGDTIYFIFSNEASSVEGAYPNGQLEITLS